MKIPIFPLGLVLMPHTYLPLHIFEERYKEMIGLCLKTGQEFGVICFDGKKLQETGCMAKVTKVLKKYPDGRMDIMTVGKKRFEIKDIDQSKSYLQANVNFIEDQSEQVDEKDIKKALKGLNMLDEINKLANVSFQTEEIDDIKKDFHKASFIIAGCPGFTIGEKQHFLELRSAKNRVKLTIDVLKKIIKRLKVKKEIKDIIQSNGHLPELL